MVKLARGLACLKSGPDRDIRKKEFTNLKVVKAYLRSSIQQEHLNSLAIMSIESDVRRG